MTMATPPRLATWLLLHLASGDHPHALVGDLVEQFQRRSSVIWYWRQALTAIATGAAHDISEHLVLGIRAIALWYLLSWCAAELTIRIHHSLGLIVWNWTIAHDFDTLRLMWFGQPRYNPSLLVATCLNAMVIGWIIARLNRRHLAATILSCMAFSAAYVVVARQLWYMLWPVTFENAPFVATIPFVVALLGAPMGLLVGGLLASDPPESTRAQLIDG